MKAMICAAALVLTAGAAQAEPVDGGTARKLLFSPTKTEVAINRAAGLSQADLKIVDALFGLKQYKALGIRYYAAMALAPGDGLQSAATTLAQGLHSPQAARAQALAACNRAKKTAPGCVIAADILPRGYRSRTLTLSGPATGDMSIYRRGKGPKAMAASRSGNAYSIVRGIGAAVQALRDCNAKSAGLSDCEVVIEDR